MTYLQVPHVHVGLGLGHIVVAVVDDTAVGGHQGHVLVLSRGLVKELPVKGRAASQVLLGEEVPDAQAGDVGVRPQDLHAKKLINLSLETESIPYLIY